MRNAVMEVPADHAASAAKGLAVIGSGVLSALAGGGITAMLLALAIVLVIKTPRSPKEWFLSVVSTLASSIFLGAWVILYFELDQRVLEALMQGNRARLYLTFVQGGGVLFACGLPGWLIIRGAFAWMLKREGKDLGEIVQELRQTVAGVPPPVVPPDTGSVPLQ